MTDIMLPKQKYLKKHNAAIRSYSDMSLLQRKLANALLYNAYYNLMNQDFHEITISALLSLLSMKTNDYKKIKETIKQLMSIVIEWNLVKKDEQQDKIDKKIFDSNENWMASSLLSSVQINGTKIKYEYSKTLRNLLYKPSVYSRLNLTVQNKFKSLYSLALYENCISYLNCRTSGWIAFEMFRRLMGVNYGQYEIFRDFNRRVLKPSVLEVNEVSDITINYEIRKTMRNPSHIKLIVEKSKKQELSIIENKEGDLSEKLSIYNFSKSDIDFILKKYSQDYILEKVFLMNQSKSNIDQPAAFLKAALKKDYKMNIKNQLKSEKSSIELYAKEKEIESKTELLNKKYRIYSNNIYKSWLLTLSIDDKLYLVESVKKYCKESVLAFCKRAELKIDFENLTNDPDVFLSLKTYIVSIEKSETLKIKLPKKESFEEYIMRYTMEPSALSGSETHEKNNVD